MAHCHLICLSYFLYINFYIQFSSSDTKKKRMMRTRKCIRYCETINCVFFLYINCYIKFCSTNTKKIRMMRTRKCIRSILIAISWSSDSPAISFSSCHFYTYASQIRQHFSNTLFVVPGWLRIRL